MRPITALLLGVLVLGTTAASADQNPARTTDPTQAQPTSPPQPAATATPGSSTTAPGPSAAATPLSATPSPATTTPVSKGVSDVPDVEKRLIAAGYKLHVGKDGQRTFCRRETPLGSHFETKVCGTAEQLAESTQNSKYLTDKIQRIDNNPPGH